MTETFGSGHDISVLQKNACLCVSECVRVDLAEVISFSESGIVSCYGVWLDGA